MKSFVALFCLMISMNIFSVEIKYPKLSAKDLGGGPDAKITDDVEAIHRSIEQWSKRFTNHYIKEFLLSNNIKEDRFDRNLLLKDFKMYVKELSVAEVKQLLIHDNSGKMLKVLDDYATQLYTAGIQGRMTGVNSEKLKNLELRLDFVTRKLAEIGKEKIGAGIAKESAIDNRMLVLVSINFLFLLMLFLKVKNIKK